MRRIGLLIFLLVFLLVAVGARGQDVLSVGTGGTQVPVTITKGTANQVQGIAFKILFDDGAISTMSFERTGALATETPLYENALQGSGWFSYVVLFAAPANVSGEIGMLTAAPIAAPGTVIALLLDPPSAMLSNQASTVIETVANGDLALVNGSMTVGPIGTPTNLVATANGTTQVSVVWNAVTNADFYQVFRSVDGSAFVHIASPGSPAHTDSAEFAGKTYLYRVRAVDGGSFSPLGNVDAATTVVFTNDPLVVESTRVKALHITELRSAVNAMRASASLPPLASDPTIAVGSTIRAQHIAAIRTGLTQARSAIGLPALSYTDTILTLIKAVHVQELRGGVK